ncbi:MAG: helix-turn-helix domain-containing protein [Desulfobacula sp.]|nr:helix-turn-helix domain-containing protein [Desulfobacula sp.]
MNTEKIFGHVLRKFRTLNKLSQEKLSQESGLDRSYISLLERGLRQPSLTTMLLLSKTLNTTAANMVRDVEEILNENIKNGIFNKKR